MTTPKDFRLHVRDNQGRRVAEIKDYTSATLKPVFNDVGTWEITLSRDSAAAQYLVIPGNGLIASRGGNIILNGPANYRKHDVNLTTNTITVSGFTDEVWLRGRDAHASPTESTSPFSQEFDERTGQASSVIGQYINYNACDPWALGPRRVPRFFVEADPALGTTVSGKARFDNLLDLVKTLALNGGVGFRVAQIDANNWVQIYAPRDLSATVKFSLGLKNLAAFTYEHTAPTANFVYVGGDGDGVAREFTENSDEESIAEWGRIEGGMVDQRSTTDETQKDQAAKDALTQGAEQASLSLTPIERPWCQYGIHYSVGDTVAVLLDGAVQTPYAESNQIVDQIRSVEINLTAQDGAIIKPTMGTPARGDLGRIFRAINWTRRRVTNLETRK